jgi:hypothetical protein
MAPDLNCNQATVAITATAAKGTAPYEFSIDGALFQSGNIFNKGVGSYEITAKDENGCTTKQSVTVKSALSDLEVSATATDIKCGQNNGLITVNASKGNPPYNYILNGGTSDK